MVRKHCMTKDEVDVVTNTRQHLPRNYWTSIYAGQTPVAPIESDVMSNAPVTTTATTVSTAPTTAPPAVTPSGDDL